MSYVYGLGADSFQVQASAKGALDHSLIPYRKKPSYLRLVNTLEKAKDYAAAGFHVSVTRGLAGGCQDLSTAFNGTGPASCSSPLNRGDLATKWRGVASAYMDAFDRRNLADAIVAIKKANALADMAFAAEGIQPPKDPVTGKTEPPQATPGKPGSPTGGFFDSAGLPIAAAAAGAWWFIWGPGKGSKKGKKGGKRKARKGGKRRSSRRRGKR